MTKESHRLSAALFVCLVLSLSSGVAAAEQRQIWTELEQQNEPVVGPMQVDTIRNLVERLSPAVVNITVSVTAYGPGIFNFQTEGQGSGVIIDREGYILSNNHVIENAQAILVRLQDGREYPATVVGRDERTDVALLKIDTGGDLPVAPLGDSDQLRVGDWVIAIGNSLGLDFTVTSGIVSALGRRGIHPDNRDLYEDFIQTDASINPGNSGGPLINLRGEVIGINTAINRLGQGIGFAIPINMVKVLIPQLLETGTVRRSCIGVSIQPMSQELAMSYGLDRPQGALVVHVNPGGPAERAGLQPGDVILRFGEEEITQSEVLPWLASIGGVGNEVELELIRGGQRQTVTVTLGELPCMETPASPVVTRSTGGEEALGIHVTELDPSTRESLRIPAGTGVVVEEIGSGSPAQGSGLRVGDVIIEVGSTPVTSPEQFSSQLSRLRRGDILRLRIRRGHSWVFLAFTI
ncbi:MAG: Do family serine endopeptidase [Bradymonadales bacterium]|nr:Do family serine endopeptidase [Bradymonadales bacterium]